MSFLRFFSPVRAYRDLRFFLSQRHPHQIVFLTLAIGLTVLLLWGFNKDSHIKSPYKEEIIYVQSWPLDRTDAQIKAQQKVDAVAKAKQDAALEKQRAANQEQFKKLDKQLDAWGL